MSSLQKQQSEFTLALSKLIQFAYSQGYELTLGTAYTLTERGPNSFHRKRLAIDLNLFRNGKYLTKTSDHQHLGIYWESLGGTWGGRFKNADGNHYSWEE